MKCTNSKAGDLILLYYVGQLSDDDRKRFEAHLLECDHCFQETYAWGPVVEHIKENPAPYLAELAKPKPPPFGIPDWIEGIVHWSGEAISAVPKATRLAAAGIAVAVTFFLVFFLIRPPGELSDLAEIEPYYFRAIVPMGAPGQTEAEKLFLQGMAHYGKEEYGSALDLLQRAVMQDSTDAEIQFFLGVTYLLQKDPDSAIKPLRAAAELDADRFEARAQWYLGNAYLLLRDREKAVEEFMAVDELEGEYALLARDMVGRLKALSKEE